MKHLSKIIAIVLFFSTTLIINKTYSQKKEPIVGIEIGNKAPEISLNNPEGKTITLSSLKGYVVLIDFWASWCGPCRKENPNVVNAYNNFKGKKFVNGKGLKIYSVSLDRDKNSWMNAIKNDKLDWDTHVSDLKFWNCEAAVPYKINSIPANFLVDKNGIIIAKNLRGETLEAELQKYLKK